MFNFKCIVHINGWKYQEPQSQNSLEELVIFAKLSVSSQIKSFLPLSHTDHIKTLKYPLLGCGRQKHYSGRHRTLVVFMNCYHLKEYHLATLATKEAGCSLLMSTELF